MRLLVLLAATSVGLLACSDGSDSTPSDVYRTVAGVLESEEHGPEIVHQWLASFPPQGRGLPLAEWDWSDFPDAETVDGTTWLTDLYNFVGTWDGEHFTITEPLTLATEPNFERTDGTPTYDCDEQDFGPILDFIDALDRDGLGIIGGGSDVWDGRCGATIEAYFDTPELRAAIAPIEDEVVTYFFMTPVDPG